MCFSCNHLVSAITVSQRSESAKKSFIDKNELIEESYGSQMSENSNHGDERTSLQCRQKLRRKRKIAYNKEAPVQRGHANRGISVLFFSKKGGFKMNELVELLDELQKKSKGRPPFCVKNCFRQGNNPIHAFCEICHAYGVPSMKWILPWRVKNLHAGNQTQHQWRRRKDSPALEGKMTSMSCFWQR